MAYLKYGEIRKLFKSEGKSINKNGFLLLDNLVGRLLVKKIKDTDGKRMSDGDIGSMFLFD